MTGRRRDPVLSAQIGNQAKSFLRHDVGHTETATCLDDARRKNAQSERSEQFEMPLPDNVVDEEASGGGRNQSGRPADHHQDEASDEPRPTGRHQFLEQRLDIVNQFAGLLLVRWLAHGAKGHH